MADFQRRIDDFAQRGIRLIAASVDSPEEAEKTRDRHGVTYPIAHSLDAGAFAAETGAFFEAERGILHSAGFVLKPDGAVAIAVYSSGAIGRLTPSECLMLIDYLTKQS